jgi:hypothetical protein
LATEILKRFKWDLEGAVDGFFNDPSAFASVGKRVDMKKVEKLFEKYKGN